MHIPAGVVAIVDDDASMLRALRRALTAFGCRVAVFASAEEYLAEVDASEIACAIIDIQLGGGVSGLDLGEQIVSVHATPVVFMTGSRDPALYRRAAHIGCIQFLEKPFPFSALIAAVVKVGGEDCA